MIELITGQMLIEYDKVVARLAITAEDLADLDGTFVETIFPEIMEARKHQIIYGRRGAGKTHLLRLVELRLRDSFSRAGILPVYVNGKQLSQEIGIESLDPATVALAVYVQLMQHIGAAISRFVMELNQTYFWERFFSGKKTQAAKEASEIAAALQDILISGQVRVLPAGEVSDKATTLAETSKNSSIGASIGANPRNLGWVMEAGTRAERSTKSSSLTTREIHGEVILPFRQVSSYLGRLLELLGQASIHVLFDEWSDVDKDPRVQPYLAEMLRRTASAVPGMYLKLACIPGRTVLATPITADIKNPIGLEEGDDIHADVNLDSIVFAGELVDQLVPFFMTMIKKHVGEKIAWVRYSKFADFESFLTSVIFSGIEPFVELCHASGGVPRDFINIYSAATTVTVNKAMSSLMTSSGAMSSQARPPFELETVREAAKNAYRSKRASFGKASSPQLQLLERIYKEIYVKKRSYLFLLTEEYAEDDDVQALYTEKLIHRWPASYYSPDEERRYQCFQLDYGTAIDRLMADAVKGEHASYENSLWAKVGLRRNNFLGHAWMYETKTDRDPNSMIYATQTDRDPNDYVDPNTIIAAYAALFQENVCRLDINPREIIFHPNRTAMTGSRGKHRSDNRQAQRPGLRRRGSQRQ